MKIKNLLLLSFLTFFSLAARAQQSDVIFTVAGEPVTLDEFKYIYEKNNASDKNIYSEKSVREYLDLYTKFKLKVKEAHTLGMDTTTKFLNEYNNYRGQLAQPYLTDRQVTQSLIDEAYNRMKYELRASHVLIAVPIDASPADTLKAYNKAMEVRNAALKGESFEKLARANSVDPSVGANGGDLGWFTAFSMIYPFESGAYALKDTGSISMPVRSRFGYHIIKLTGKRPNRGEIQVRYILINSLNTDPVEKQKLAKNKVDSIYGLLQKGVPFADLARQFSEHSSKNNGGELPRFNSFGNAPEVFKDQAYSLKKNGDFTKPFYYANGWHILQRMDYKPLASEKEMEEVLKSKIAKDSRSEKSREAAIEKFKGEFNYKGSDKALNKYVATIDTSLLRGDWKPGKKQLSKKELFSLDGKKYTYTDFSNYLENAQKMGRYSDVNYAVRQYFKKYVDDKVLALEDANLDKKYPEFKNVSKEYKEGLLLFEITDQKVWGKAMTDSAGRKAYFEANRDKYRWKERADAIIVDLRNQSDVPVVMDQLKYISNAPAETPAVKQNKTTEKKPAATDKRTSRRTVAKSSKKAAAVPIVEKPKTIEELADLYVKKDPLSFNYKNGVFERGDNRVLDTVSWAPGVYNAGQINGRYNVVKIDKIIPPSYKELNDTKGVVIADYQDYLEKQWVDTLKAKYEIKVNEDVVQKLIKK
jgi:peptidyl-prolyl cis-trans isomerase SurA